MKLPRVKADRCLALEQRRGTRLRPDSPQGSSQVYAVTVPSLAGYKMFVTPLGSNNLGVRVELRHPGKAPRQWREADWLMRDVFGG